MKHIFKHSAKLLIASVLLAFCGYIAAFAGERYSLIGKTDSKAMGKEETKTGLVLHVDASGSRNNVFLEGYEMLGYKDISIKAYVITAPDGTITDYGDVVIEGVVGAKVKSATGFLTKTSADITLDGKVAGVFNFHIRYRAGK